MLTILNIIRYKVINWKKTWLWAGCWRHTERRVAGWTGRRWTCFFCLKKVKVKTSKSEYFFSRKVKVKNKWKWTGRQWTSFSVSKKWKWKQVKVNRETVNLLFLSHKSEEADCELVFFFKKDKSENKWKWTWRRWTWVCSSFANFSASP